MKGGYTLLRGAAGEGHESKVELLLFEGDADYSYCKEHRLVKSALVTYREEIMTSLAPWLPLPDLCAIVTGYYHSFLKWFVCSVTVDVIVGTGEYGKGTSCDTGTAFGLEYLNGVAVDQACSVHY